MADNQKATKLPQQRLENSPQFFIPPGQQEKRNVNQPSTSQTIPSDNVEQITVPDQSSDSGMEPSTAPTAARKSSPQIFHPPDQQEKRNLKQHPTQTQTISSDNSAQQPESRIAPSLSAQTDTRGRPSEILPPTCQKVTIISNPLKATKNSSTGTKPPQ